MRLEWDFSRLPADEHRRLIELYEDRKWWEIIAIHDRYELSENNYCCSNTLSGVKNWIEHGIKTGQIQQVEKGTSEAQNEQAPEV